MESSPSSSPHVDHAALAESWRARVDDLTVRAVAALSAGEHERLPAFFAEIDTWSEPQRAYQARCRLADAVLAYRPPRPQQWIPAFMTAARCLLDVLAREPREPVLLNSTGILLYELMEAAAAEQLFRAAHRLDPELSHVRQNLDAARRSRNTTASLPAPFGASTRVLSKRARAVAGQARPVEGLTLSLCMIVKDEEEMLPGCLAAVHDVVDEMVIVDTGSRDGTVEIARSFGAKVIEFPWNGSFSDARNVSLDNATSDWVMYLDADEHLVDEDAAQLRDVLRRTWREAFYLVETNFTGGEDSGAAVTHHALRLWRHRPQYRFEGRIHEQKTHTMPTYLPERFETTAVRMKHYGYLRSRIAAKDKSKRNIELLEIEAREAPSPFNDYNLGSEYLSLGDHPRAREYFDRAWDALRAEERWKGAGYAPLLVARVANARRGAGDREAARAAITEGLAAYPDHTDLVLEQALCARDEGDLRDAAELAERCLEMGDAPARYACTVGAGSFLALCLLADVRETCGQADEAERLYRRSLAEHPEYTAPVLPLVSLLLRRDATPAELAVVVADRPSTRLLAATACYEQGRHDLAESWFRDVLEVQPANGVARVGLVEALLSQRRLDDAAAEAAREAADSVLAAAATGARLFALGAAGHAAELEQAVAEAPARGVPWYDVELFRAWADALAGRPAPRGLPAEAGPSCATALEALLKIEDVDGFAGLLPLWGLVDRDPRAQRDELARIYFRRGFLESAADEWIASVSEAPDSRSLVGLAQVALARGLDEDAALFAEEAVTLDPGAEDARRLLAGINQKQLQRS